MPVKMTGREFKAFMASDWGDLIIEEETTTVGGLEFDLLKEDPSWIADDARVVLTGGVVFKEGVSRFEDVTDAEIFARRWLKSQKTKSVVVDVDKAKLAEFREYVAKFSGAKISS